MNLSIFEEENPNLTLTLKNFYLASPDLIPVHHLIIFSMEKDIINKDLANLSLTSDDGMISSTSTMDPDSGHTDGDVAKGEVEVIPLAMSRKKFERAANKYLETQRDYNDWSALPHQQERAVKVEESHLAEDEEKKTLDVAPASGEGQDEQKLNWFGFPEDFLPESEEEDDDENRCITAAEVFEWMRSDRARERAMEDA